jgi:hypothetical protein
MDVRVNRKYREEDKEKGAVKLSENEIEKTRDEENKARERKNEERKALMRE